MSERFRASRAALLWAGLGVGVVALAAAGPAATEKPGMSIAVVDMDRVLRNSQQWRDSVDRREQMLQQGRRTLDRLSRAVQVLRNEVENLPPGTDEREARRQELDRALKQLQQETARLDARVSEQYNAALAELMRRLSAAVAECARERGVRLVLKKQDLTAPGRHSPERSLMMATTEVLYADPALDISAQVVEKLNAGYEGPIEVK